MTGDEMHDAIFGEGSAAECRANEQSHREHVALYAARPYTPSGVLKASKMTVMSGGCLCIEASDLTGMGWPLGGAPDRITVAFDAAEDPRCPFDLHIYRRWLTDRTPGGDIAAWIYVPNCPEQAPVPEIHVIND